MSFAIDMAYKSYFHFGEELCGDKVEIVSTEDSKTIILADGMGSGVRANILSTMTSKILGTLMFKDLSIDEAVETIAKTLPVSSVNGVAYSTFSIIQIFKDGRTYIVEYDNPVCVCIRKHQLYELPFTEREVYGKKIRECHIMAEIGDAFLAMSDGCIWCSGDGKMNLAWDRDAVAAYVEECEKKTKTAGRLAAMVDDMCYDLYMGVPKDDTTVAVARIKEEKIVRIMTGPPLNKEDDPKFVNDFMMNDDFKIVCGGSTSELVARELGEDISSDTSTMDGEIPPMSRIRGVDLVTEGVVTLSHVLNLLETYASDEFDVDFFIELDKKNGASRIASVLIDDCTKIYMYVGTAANSNADQRVIRYDLSVRKNIVDSLKNILEKLDKEVEIVYY